MEIKEEMDEFVKEFCEKTQKTLTAIVEAQKKSRRQFRLRRNKYEIRSSQLTETSFLQITTGSIPSGSSET